MNELTLTIAQGSSKLSLERFDAMDFATSWWQHPIVIVAVVTFVGTLLMVAGIRWLRRQDAQQEGPLVREVLSHAELTAKDRAIIEAIRTKACLPATATASMLISRGFFEKIAHETGVMQTDRESCAQLATRLFGS